MQTLAKIVQQSPKVTILWTVQPHVNEAALTLVPGDLSTLTVTPTGPPTPAVTNSAVDTYNRVVETLLVGLLSNLDQVVIWSSLSRVADMTIHQMPGGVFLPDKVTDQGNSVRTRSRANSNNLQIL